MCFSTGAIESFSLTGFILCITRTARNLFDILPGSPHLFSIGHDGRLTIIEPLAVRVASVHELGHYAFRLRWIFRGIVGVLAQVRSLWSAVKVNFS